jgi:AraC-like DNA-binding protein
VTIESIFNPLLIFVSSQTLLAMKSISIPDCFIEKSSLQHYEAIAIINYKAEQVSAKNPVTLNQNVFAFLREGYKTVSYSDKHAEINNTKFLLLSAGNCLMSEKKADGNGLYRSTMLLFDNTVLTSFFLKYPQLLSKAMRVPEHEEPFIVFNKDAFIENFITSLDLLTSSTQEFSNDIKRLKFEELMLYLCNAYPQQIVNLRTTVQETREDAEIRIAAESNIQNNITVEELAFLCNTSVSTFKRRFTKIYGSSPNKWMILKRMELAANLLKQGNEKPSDVYYKVGYENLSSFIQSFKQIYGVTPKEYQQRRLNA